jgi:GNAT superfamily N-acetyltransferase
MTKFTIREATKTDLDLLPDLEKRSDETFRAMPRFEPMLAMEGLSLEECHNLPPSTQIWIAETHKPVGFVYTCDIDDLTYFGQLSVVPEAQNRGIGSALLNVAVQKAREENKPGLVLTTFRDVAFNAPFYARRGFIELATLHMGPELTALAKEDEKQWGAFSPRVVMGRFF